MSQKPTQALEKRFISKKQGVSAIEQISLKRRPHGLRFDTAIADHGRPAWILGFRSGGSSQEDSGVFFWHAPF